MRCDLFCKHSVWISKRPLGRTPIPVTKHERRSNMWNFIIGAMFGGMCGVGIVCLTVIGKRADEDMEHIEKKKETSALEGKVSE